MSYTARSFVRSAKNMTKGYSEIEVKVREATSNDPWGPSGNLMAEIAKATFIHSQFLEIMEMIFKRTNDSGKNWRHVYKSLTLLDYLIHSGSERVIEYAKENIHQITTLKEFQYIDDEGKDQGLNVRQRSKEIVALLSDEVRLREERRIRKTLMQRLDSQNRTGSNEYDQEESVQYTGHIREHDETSVELEEQRQLERAIEESKRTAKEHEERMKKNDKELQRAIDESRHDDPSTAAPVADLLGGSNNDLKAGNNGWATSSTAGGFGQPDFQPSRATTTAQAKKDLFGDSAFDAAVPSRPTNNQLLYDDSFGGPGVAAAKPKSSAPFASNDDLFGGPAVGKTDAAFGAAPFDAFSTAQNPNARLAEIARNSADIDPFANLARDRSTSYNSVPTTRPSQNPFGNAGANAANHDFFGPASNNAPAISMGTPLQPQLLNAANNNAGNKPAAAASNTNSDGVAGLAFHLPTEGSTRPVSMLVNLDSSALRSNSTRPGAQAQSNNPFASSSSSTAAVLGSNYSAVSSANPSPYGIGSGIGGGMGLGFGGSSTMAGGSGFGPSNPMAGTGIYGAPATSSFPASSYGGGVAGIGGGARGFGGNPSLGVGGAAYPGSLYGAGAVAGGAPVGSNLGYAGASSNVGNVAGGYGSGIGGGIGGGFGGPGQIYSATAVPASNAADGRNRFEWTESKPTRTLNDLANDQRQSAAPVFNNNPQSFF